MFDLAKAERVIVLSNFSEQPQVVTVPAHGPATDLISNQRVSLDSMVTLEACQQVWLFTS